MPAQQVAPAERRPGQRTCDDARRRRERRPAQAHRPSHLDEVDAGRRVRLVHRHRGETGPRAGAAKQSAKQPSPGTSVQHSPASHPSSNSVLSASRCDSGSITKTGSTPTSCQVSRSVAGGELCPQVPISPKSSLPSISIVLISPTDQVVYVVTGVVGRAVASRSTRPPSSGPCVPPSRKRWMFAQVLAKRTASSWSSRTAGSSTRARSSTSSPSGVGREPVWSRSKRGPPSAFSIRRSCVLSAGLRQPEGRRRLGETSGVGDGPYGPQVAQLQLHARKLWPPVRLSNTSASHLCVAPGTAGTVGRPCPAGEAHDPVGEPGPGRWAGPSRRRP